MTGFNNKLREIRMKEGLTIVELSKLSNLSEKVVRDIESGKKPGKEVTRRKIVKGLNNNPEKSRTWEYEEIFGS